MERIAVGAIIVVDSDHMIVVEKQTIETINGKVYREPEFDFVKGGVVAGERMEEALFRELYEETGSDNYDILEKLDQKLTFDFPKEVADQIGYLTQITHFYIVNYKGNVNELAPNDREIKAIHVLKQENVLNQLTHPETKNYFKTFILSQERSKK